MWTEVVSVWMQIGGTVCAIITTVFAARRYRENREFHLKRMETEQKIQDIKAQEYMLLVARNEEIKNLKK
jgi:hypothetical protein